MEEKKKNNAATLEQVKKEYQKPCMTQEQVEQMKQRIEEAKAEKEPAKKATTTKNSAKTPKIMSLRGKVELYIQCRVYYIPIFSSNKVHVLLMLIQ